MMHSSFFALWLLSMYDVAQAAALTQISPRDTCDASMKCNTAGCDGLNDAAGPGKGYCLTGDCAGKACTSVCADKPGPCDGGACNGFLGPSGTDWFCSAGDFNGCSCTSICPAADDIPACNDPGCKGSSNTVDKFGVCGLGKWTDCTCKNSCPTTLPKCGDSGCQGINDPKGGKSVCLAGSNIGCPCTSECPTGKCNAIDGCEGFNDVGGKSFCTAGASSGCFCEPVCPDTKASCTATGCNGIQSSSGDGFCTSGELKGCSCASKCPNTKPTCTDDSCAGYNGQCTKGAAWGCNCSGGAGSSRKKRSVELTKRVESDGSSDIPFPYYVCMQLAGQDDSQGVVSYSRNEIFRAMRQGFLATRSWNDDPIQGSNGRWYPGRFYAEAGWNIPAGIDVNDLFEFPLTPESVALNGQGFVTGDDPGPDRVVFQGSNMRFVGVFTHRGEDDNRFHQAWGNGQALNFDGVTYPDHGPSNGDFNALPWIGGGFLDGGGNLPYKRDSATSPGGTTAGNGDGGDAGDGSTDPTAAVCTPGQGKPTKTYSLDYGKAAINFFCTDGGTRQISSSGTYNKEAIYGYQDKQGKTTSVALITRMYYVNVDGCSTKAGAVYEPSIQECKDNFGAAMNQCQTGTTSDKAGSYKVFDKGDAGCVAFDLMPCAEVDGKASADCDPFYGAYNKFKIGG